MQARRFAAAARVAIVASMGSTSLAEPLLPTACTLGIEPADSLNSEGVTLDQRPGATGTARPQSLQQNGVRQRYTDGDERYTWTLRGAMGFGLGGIGVGYRLGGEIEYFFSELFGVGIQGGALSEHHGGLLESGIVSSGAFVAPTAVVRTASRSSYFIATVSAGYSNISHTYVRPLCIDVVASPCPSASPSSTNYGGYALGAALGYLAHPSNSFFELGPTIRMDLAGNFRGDAPVDYLFTLNLELGLALPTRN